MRQADSLVDRAPRLSPAGDRSRNGDAAPFLRGRPAECQLRHRPSIRAGTNARGSEFPVPGRARSGEPRGGDGVSPQRSRARVAVVIFSVEQRAGRGTARRRRARAAEGSGGPRSAGPAHAGVSAIEDRAGQEFRRPVAAVASSRQGGAERYGVSGFRREPARGLPRGNQPLRRQHAARGSQRGGAAERELHLRQRTSGAPLSDSQTSTGTGSGGSRSTTTSAAAACSVTAVS